jgi:hypothetical protein
MARWNDLESAQPEIATTGRKILYQHGPGLAYLATVRADSGLRIHPFCPVVTRGGIYGLIGHSPKRADLARNPNYAIHAFPVPERDDEFMLAGTARRIHDSAEVADVLKAYLETGATSSGDEWTFEFLIERALLSLYETRDSGKPTWPPKYLSWQSK